MPVDEPVVHGAGDDPHNVLVIGNGIAMSYGVLSHQIGFGGHFARQLAERTGRGSEVKLVVGSELDVGGARDAIVAARPARFDAIVLTLGGAEAVRLMPANEFRRELDTTLDLIEHLTTAQTRTFVVGAAPLGQIVHIPHFAAQHLSNRALSLNEQLRLACQAHANADYVPFEPRHVDLVHTRDRSTYEEWGSLVAAGVAEWLLADADRSYAVESVDEQERLRALESLRILETPNDVRFDRIAETAKDLFGVASASINFIDDHRQWVKAVAGGEPENAPRSEAICDFTIRRPGAFVVNDATAHPRFRDLPAVRAGRVRFYAGYPIEAPNGMRVGALCLLDPVPRAFGRSDKALLRELALRVQNVLRDSAAA